MILNALVRPHFIRTTYLRPTLPVAPGPLALRGLGPDRQPFLPVEAVGALVAHWPILPPQENVQSAIACPRANPGSIVGLSRPARWAAGQDRSGEISWPSRNI
jgi:hypothetical protein